MIQIRPLLIFIISICLQAHLYACGGLAQPAYAGEISYKIDIRNPLLCTATLSFDFDVAELPQNDSITVNWGDGDSSVIYAQSVQPDTAANLPLGYEKYYRHTYVGDHRYAASGIYSISILNLYRSGNIININGGNASSVPYYIESKVMIDTAVGYSNKPAIVYSSTLTYAYLNLPYTRHHLITDPDAAIDSVVYELVDPLQAAANSVPAYKSPEQVCQTLGINSGFSINAANGDISWMQPCEQGFYSVAVLKRKFINGRMVGSIIRDEVICVRANGNVGIIEPTEQILQLSPNPTNDVLSATIPTGTMQHIDVRIMSTDGQIVSVPLLVRGDKIEADVHTLPAGLYYLQVNEGTHMSHAKFVKQ